MVTMPCNLLVALALTQGPISRIVTPSERPLVPDVLLARSDEATEAESGLNAGRLDGAKILFLTTKSPIVVCYGRLAQETRASRSKIASAVDLLQNGDATNWTKERTEAVRAMMDSPFRDTVRVNAKESLPMTLKFSRTTTLALAGPGGYYRIMRLGKEPVGKAVDLAGVPPRVTDVPMALPTTNDSMSPSRAVSCIVPRRTKGSDMIPLMQSGLKALATRQIENVDLLVRSLPKPPSLEITSDERDQAISYFADAYKDLGYASREAATAGLRNAVFIKYASLEADVDTTRDGHTSQVGWTVTNLPNP